MLPEPQTEQSREPESGRPPAPAAAVRLIHRARQAGRKVEPTPPETRALEDAARRAVGLAEDLSWLERAPDAPGDGRCKVVTRLGMCPWAGPQQPARTPERQNQDD